MMKKVPELLVPAGGMEQLKAAVACGADAVYLGGPSFSARARADNFSQEELKQAIEYAHTCGVRVHVALNTLLTDDELLPALEFAAEAYKDGADAVIVQDTGLFSMLRRHLPKLPLHLSTQGTVTDLNGVRAAAAKGAERVILARELSLEEIREICRSKGRTEIEIFVHGAICISLSGQCHMSGMAGGRSGNRGDCAQPCRLRYLLTKHGEEMISEGYQLSPKDQCLLSHLEQIAEAGVDSVKIEGRMKSPEYVAAVTKIYRKHLDLIRSEDSETAARCIPDDLRVLRQIYSRGRFTDSYFRGNAYADLMSGLSPKHQGLPAGKMEDYHKKSGHATVRLSEPLSIGDGVEIRGRKGTADNVVTYLRDSKGRMVKSAEKGSVVEAGDLRIKRGIPEKGSEVFKLTDRKMIQDLRQEYRRLPQRIPVRFRLRAAEGEPLILEGKTEERGRSFRARSAGSELLKPARSGEVDPESLKVKLSRTGDTPYFCAESVVELQGIPFIRAAVLNELRRQVLSELTLQRLSALQPGDVDKKDVERRYRGTFPGEDLFFGNSGKKSVVTGLEIPQYQLYFYNTPDLEDRLRTFLEKLEQAGFNNSRLILCLPLDLFLKKTGKTDLYNIIENSGCRLNVVLPVEMRRTGWTKEKLEDLFRSLAVWKPFRAMMIADAGQLSSVKRAGIPFETDSHLNVLNSATAGYWLSEGALSVCLAEEPEALRSFRYNTVLENCCVSVYGRVPVMYLEHCPVGSHGFRNWHKRFSGTEHPCCSETKKYGYCKEGKWSLYDRTGSCYPLEADSRCCRAIIYSKQKIDRSEEKEELFRRGVRMFRLCFYDETPEEMLSSLKSWM